MLPYAQVIYSKGQTLSVHQFASKGFQCREHFTLQNIRGLFVFPVKDEEQQFKTSHRHKDKTFFVGLT